MNFHSFQFALFLVVVLGLYWSLANKRTARYLVLLGASYVFYGAYELWYLGLIVFSTLLDYHCGKRIHGASEKRRRTLWLLASLGGNLGLLCFFKYTDWAVDSLQLLLDTLGADADVVGAKTSFLPQALMDSPAMRIIVPVGISFYTFQTLSYTIDIYRGKLAPARNLREFALFVAFFPQLVAGPIVRAIEFLPQLELRPRFDKDRFHDGLYRMGLGLAKKVMLADVIGRYLVDPVYGAPEEYTAVAHVLCLYGFAFQIYFDFAGYSDIAIGTARMLGFDLPENFLLPYRSRSVREFWRRWHVSLSFWVRDYIFIPLGGSRGHTEMRIARNLLITMLVIGVWHGASILWVIYGLLQGTVMILERQFERLRGGKEFATSTATSLLSWAMTFHFIVFTCLFIRGTSLEQIGALLSKTGDVGADELGVWGIVALGFGMFSHFMPPVIGERFAARLKALPTLVCGVLIGVVVGLVAVLVVGETPYIYFEF